VKPVTYARLLISVVPGGISILEKAQNARLQSELPCKIDRAENVDLYTKREARLVAICSSS
jgi:hypothetical protein